MPCMYLAISTYKITEYLQLFSVFEENTWTGIQDQKVGIRLDLLLKVLYINDKPAISVGIENRQ